MAQVEEECNDVNMELMRCKANLDGMKLDVNMHLEWTEKLRALLAKQTKYAADLTAKLEEIKADVARLEQEKTVAEAGQSQVPVRGASPLTRTTTAMTTPLQGAA